ncbi:SUMF1/EgtB/PvdO family nonheme iron enzyme [Micromonospora echinofusca]|uniref:SUMF1/EgtB/PvdO family nonheme iron enzyme n=1 Tax=Micromonospora echinofusca TaxID=47858 RepID=A0ABS3VUE5_MICEH|nr:SUMF1/EgtB/PvdO family nonheme iron enzyme [Micromonospora echinofusca]MBO4208157.1 SUMF1/EgtB/PvdO family nonheme iron enzyme [Micromonospora echinofusca]
MAAPTPVSIGALLLAPASYRHLPAVPWLADGEIHAGLRWQLDHHYRANVVSLKDNQLGSPGAARNAVACALQTLADSDILLVAVAGHYRQFTRGRDTLAALALPGSVPGRPRSMLAIADLLEPLVDTATTVIVCADLIGDQDPAEALARTPGVSVLYTCRTTPADLSLTCHDAVCCVLEDLAAAGAQRSTADLLDDARQRCAAAGGDARMVHRAADTALASVFAVEQLPAYLREDLSSLDPGSRLDAVADLATVADGSPFARAILTRLAVSDRAQQVRSYADVVVRQAEQPSLPWLLTTGRIPREAYEAALTDPVVPQLLPQPAGEAVIGVDAPDGQPSCRPRHTVRLAPYRLARTVVTNRQYLAFLAAEDGPCPDHWATDRQLWAAGDLPVVMVSWLDAARYCAWLTRHLHSTGGLPASARIVLPSEVEWENAARNGRSDLHPWGDSPDPGHANIRSTGIHGLVCPGHFSPAGDSVTGCQDLIGNVSEWTRSLWGHGGHDPTYRYPYRGDDGREVDSGRANAHYVIRGGTFYYATECANSFTRNRLRATARHPANGFRVMSTDDGTAG